MVKDANTVIESVSCFFFWIILIKIEIYREFNSLVNMSASELGDWLQGKPSQSSGWSKSDSGDNETIGHERFSFPLLITALIISSCIPIKLTSSLKWS